MGDGSHGVPPGHLHLDSLHIYRAREVVQCRPAGLLFVTPAGRRFESLERLSNDWPPLDRSLPWGVCRRLSRWYWALWLCWPRATLGRRRLPTVTRPRRAPRPCPFPGPFIWTGAWMKKPGGWRLPSRRLPNSTLRSEEHTSE